MISFWPSTKQVCPSLPAPDGRCSELAAIPLKPLCNAKIITQTNVALSDASQDNNASKTSTADGCMIQSALTHSVSLVHALFLSK